MTQSTSLTRCSPLTKGQVSPARPVPPHIPRPEYALTGETRRGHSMKLVTTPDDVARLRAACRAARQVLDVTLRAVRPGVTTDALDALAHQTCIDLDAYPSPLNYGHFPKSVCTSVNEVICHGIPDDRPLADGDIVNVDVTVYLGGMHGDCSETALVGDVDASSRRLVDVSRDCLARGVAAVRSGGRVRDIGRVVSRCAHKHGFSVVRAYCGHGIGEYFHGELIIPHNYDPGARTRLVPGMAFTVEPMINAGTWRCRVWDDGWTAVTTDGARSAQFEHTVLVTDSGVEILTLPQD